MTTPVTLRFAALVTPTPAAVNLLFGAETAFAPRVEGSLAAALPPADLPGLSLASEGVLWAELITDVGPVVGAPHGRRPAQATALGVGQQAMQSVQTSAAARHAAAAPVRAPMVLRQSSMLPSSRASVHLAQQAIPLVAGVGVAQQESTRQQQGAGARHQHGLPLGQGVRSDHQERIRLRHRLRADQRQAESVVTRGTAGHQSGRPLYQGVTVRHQQMIPVPLGWWQIAYPWPEPPFDPNAPSSPVALKFCRLADGTTALVFGCRPYVPPPPPGEVVVPIRRAYIVLNTITLVRASDGAPLDATALTLQIDADSWTWGWDATIPGAQLALVEPAEYGEPVELIATVNGQSFRLLAERIARDRRFGESRLRVSGRGRAGLLAAPHSPIVTRHNDAAARTTQQLLADALTDNGVSLGWAIDWQPADWLVPAGAWHHTGSYIEHAQRIAEAAGAYVQADPVADTLRILPRYPVLPWEWATSTPDIELPSAPVVRESIEWVERPAYNRVFVSGATAGGILGQVTRAGTAGNIVAPMVTDPLITHADAARARGRAILADTGRQARVTLDLPILPETGIIAPGKLIRYTDAGTVRMGLVRGTAVRAQLPTARQSIELETHA